MEAEQQEVKRLKFSKDEEEEEDEDDEEEEQEVDTLRPSHATCLSKEAEAMVQEEEEKVEYSKENEASTSAATTEDQGNIYFIITLFFYMLSVLIGSCLFVCLFDAIKRLCYRLLRLHILEKSSHK